MEIWTQEKNRQLTELWPLASWEEIEQALPTHTKASIYKQASALKLVRSRPRGTTAKLKSLPKVLPSTQVQVQDLSANMQLFFRHLVTADNSFCKIKKTYDRYLLVEMSMRMIRDGEL